MLADELDYVIGVDTHRDEHALAMVACPSGAALAEALVGADERGYAEALALAQERAPGRRAWAIEGSGSYGKGLARYLAARGECLYELERPRRAGRRGRAKSDRLDALRAARWLLAEGHPASPRAGGGREALRVLLQVRASAVAARKVALGQLRALLVTCPEPLRAELRPLTRARLLARCRSLAQDSEHDPELAATRLAARLATAVGKRKSLRSRHGSASAEPDFVGRGGAYRDRTGDLRLAKPDSSFRGSSEPGGIPGGSRPFTRSLAGIAVRRRPLPANSCGMHAG